MKIINNQSSSLLCTTKSNDLRSLVRLALASNFPELIAETVRRAS